MLGTRELVVCETELVVAVGDVENGLEDADVGFFLDFAEFADAVSSVCESTWLVVEREVLDEGPAVDNITWPVIWLPRVGIPFEPFTVMAMELA